MSKVLDLGCGEKKHGNAVGIDVENYSCVDKVFDIDGTSWEFASENEFNRVYAHHILEHMRHLDDVMEEIKRICVNGARVYVRTPYYLHPNYSKGEGHKRKITPFYFKRHPSFKVIGCKKHYPSPQLGRVVEKLNLVSKHQPDEYRVKLEVKK